MLAEIEIIPIGTQSPSLSSLLAEVAKLIDRSGLDYRVGPIGTTLETQTPPTPPPAKSGRSRPGSASR